jgi:fructokinase
MPSRSRVGIDLGGTKIEGIVLAADGRELLRRRVPTPAGYEETLKSIADLITGIERDTDSRGTIGIGIPGIPDAKTGLVKNANSTGLIGHPLGADLEHLLGREVRIENDANCFAMSEASDGAGAGADIVFGAILGTGVGGGVVIGGRLIQGVNRIAGEWGHNSQPWMTPDEYPGPPCYCGKIGCIESLCSGPGFEAEFERRTGRALGSREIVAAAEKGDAEAIAALSRYVDRVARATASMINILDPDVVVMGGGMSNLPDLAARVQSVLPRYVFSDTVLTRVVKNIHGDSSGVRGAAWLWPATE